MNAKIKAQWLADLRSGEFRQGRGQLRTPDGAFCCLGVLAQRYNDIAEYGNCKRDAIFCLPKDYGISDDIQASLVKMNDCSKKSFAEIADWIEANL